MNLIMLCSRHLNGKAAPMVRSLLMRLKFLIPGIILSIGAANAQNLQPLDLAAASSPETQSPILDESTLAARAQPLPPAKAIESPQYAAGVGSFDADSLGNRSIYA